MTLMSEREWLGNSAMGYDLLAEAPKPEITLPQEDGVAIRFKDQKGIPTVAQRCDGSWFIEEVDYKYCDEYVLDRGAKDGYEVAYWYKPGEGPGLPKKLHEKLRGMDFNSPIFRAVAGPGHLLSGNIHPQQDVLDVLRWAASQPVQDGEA